jgi:N-acetylglutamate synthase-like GNAT family acetyltransferase
MNTASAGSAREMLTASSASSSYGMAQFTLSSSTPMVTARAGRRGVGTQLVALAVAEARAAGCEWLHADFEDHLRAFYFDACGFSPTNAGLIAL